MRHGTADRSRLAGCHRRQGTEGRWKTGDMSVARFDWSNFGKPDQKASTPEIEREAEARGRSKGCGREVC